MPLLLAAQVWHYWVAVALLIPVVLGLIGMFTLYLAKVRAAKEPRQ